MLYHPSQRRNKVHHQQLHEKAIATSKKFHQAESDLITILQELDQHKTFRHYHCTSLFDYCLKHLKLSEANTSNFITVARKAKEIPELKRAIQEQNLSVSKARKITAVITAQNADEWLSKAKTLPKNQLEKEVAKVSPKSATPEKAKYVTEDRIYLQLGISEKTFTDLKRAQDIESQKSHKAATMENILEEALKLYLQKNDPVQKAERLAKPIQEHVPGTRQLSAQTKHNVNKRDQGQCTHQDQNIRCSNKRWTDIHHQIPLSQGGSNDLDNLTTLCWAHHHQHHAPAKRLASTQKYLTTLSQSQ